MTTKYGVWTAEGGEGSEPVRIRDVGRYPTRAKAMAAAKRLAGRGAQFVARGIDHAYVGAGLTAWIENGV